MSIYGFWQGPTYRPSTRDELFGAALEQPMSLGATFWDQAKGGVLESFGLGTAIRTLSLPPAAQTRRGRETDAEYQARQERVKGITEEEYKASPYFRENVPWDSGMTEDRAAALATMNDAKRVREYFAEKRPITSFFGNLAGQATDPINYIPVAGPTVKAAAVARMGVVKGIAATAALDAAANTAIAGLATRETRRGFGDDVSWQMMVSEIATAALLGTAFGTVGGVLQRRAGIRADALRSEAEVKVNTLRATQEARIALNEAIGGLANDGEVRLSPNGVAPVQRLISEVDRSWAGRAVEGQSVVTPTGLRVAVKSEIVDAMDLIKASGELQPRDRSRAASDAQIAEMAANLDPARLMFSPEADRGAPIVGPDGVVESGNGRIAALIRAAQTNPERFAAYKQALKDAGFDVPDKGIPVLVSRRVGDLTDAQRAQFVNDANTSAIARMSATETAMMDTRAMTSGTLGNYVPGDINSAANRAFVGSFLRNLPSNERLSLVDADGRLNADGIRRIENALIAAAYGDADVVARFAETPDDNVKSIMGAMSDAAGEWSAMRKDIAEGLIDADFDVTPSLTDALRFMSRAREKAVAEKRPVATVIKEEMGQLDLLAGEIDPRTKAFVLSFYKNDQFTQANGRDIIADHLRNITRAARDLGKPSLFGDAIAVRPQEMIENARPQARQGDLLGAVGSRQGGGTDRAGQEVISLFGDSQAVAQSDGRGFRADVATTMAKRFHEAGRTIPEAEAAARLIDDFYATAAARAGVSVDRLVDEVGLPEVRGPSEARVVADAMFQAAPPVESPAFKSWFGKSKVVDADGKPLVVFHGGVEGIEKFESSSWRFRDFMVGDAREKVVNANFFAADRAVADSYRGKIEADNVREGDKSGVIYDVYLRIENPLEVDWKGKRFTTGDPSRLIEKARAGGHDGLIVTNVIDDYRQKAKPTTIYVTLAGEQIKSVNNRGTFDASDPRILFQPAWHGSPHLFDKFSLDAIGTGEGAQAYGWGLYFASKREVSEWYRNNLAGRPSIKIGGVAVDQADPLGKVDDSGTPVLLDSLRPLMRWPDGATKADGSPLPPDFFAKNDGWLAASLAHEIRNLQYGTGNAGRKMDILVKERRDELADALESAVEDRDLADVYVHQAALEAIVDAGVEVAPAGRLFKVDVPDDAELLDWDLPLSEQTPAIKAALKTLGIEERPVPKITDVEMRSIVRRALERADGDADQVGTIIDNEASMYATAARLQRAAAAADNDDMSPGEWLVAQPDVYKHLQGVRKNAELTGSVIHGRISNRASDGLLPGEQEADMLKPLSRRASEALRAAGIPGHKYKGHESDSTNFVIYDDSRVNVLDFEQGGKRGSIQFGDSGKTVISLFENADASTALHETGHYFLGMFKGIAEKSDAPNELKADWRTVKDWWGANADDVARDSPMDGITGDDVRAVLASGTTGDRVKDMAIDVGLHEQWARAFESYLRDGIAPTERLRSVFRQFQEWLTKIYKQAVDLNVKMTPELRGVFDRMLGAPRKDPRNIDASPARPEPPPTGRAEAEAKVAKPENYKALADQYRVDPEAGTFPEEAELRQLAQAGRLSDEDMAVLDDADAAFQDGVSYGEALKSVVSCLL